MAKKHIIKRSVTENSTSVSCIHPYDELDCRGSQTTRKRRKRKNITEGKTQKTI